jgi:hypothetical protein
MWLVERHKHVPENALHPGQAAYFVERVFEVGLCCVEIAHPGDISGLQRFKKMGNSGHSLTLWRHICGQGTRLRRGEMAAHGF